MNMPPEDAPVPETLQTLRCYAEDLALLLGYEVITAWNHVDVDVLAAFIRAHGWHGEVEVVERESVLGLYASIAFFDLDGVGYHTVGH